MLPLTGAGFDFCYFSATCQWYFSWCRFFSGFWAFWRESGWKCDMETFFGLDQSNYFGRVGIAYTVADPSCGWGLKPPRLAPTAEGASLLWHRLKPAEIRVPKVFASFRKTSANIILMMVIIYFHSARLWEDTLLIDQQSQSHVNRCVRGIHIQLVGMWTGYYYNFRNDVIADDPSHIMLQTYCTETAWCKLHCNRRMEAHKSLSNVWCRISTHSVLEFPQYDNFKFDPNWAWVSWLADSRARSIWQNRSKAHEQKAIALLQKNIRGAITRKRIQKELKALKLWVIWSFWQF